MTVAIWIPIMVVILGCCVALWLSLQTKKKEK